ncbi:DUF2293 domain-containing protein [Amycolatopsis cihanbeyliensis]|uniref:DUF2293 domain-containing protein n=1 Tax=Amycolatopsis cihanbeyliensis TaxID=1128664 RepID=A0A542DNE2_AMYCI|nr:DUF2293 domain-containing protein [Amycolatopsis cihanbeyliensis]TQJ04603.1 hypothetical protein FB471_4404 [Amycolatopsis cihanbeyliensis]
MARLRSRVLAAAENALARDKYVAPIELLGALGWLPPPRAEEWRQGRIPYLAQALPVEPDRILSVLGYLREWAEDSGLVPTEIGYPAGTRDRRPLRFTASGDESLERSFRTHWISTELPEGRRRRLETRQAKAPDLVVTVPAGAWECAGCAAAAPAGEFLLLEEGEPLCLACADLDHLSFLPAGNAALSRRAKKESPLSAVVLEFNRRRNRYERRGVLVDRAALELAERQCLADEDVRARRRERDAVRRADQDVRFQAAMAERIRELYPGCPPERAAAIAEHAGTRSSGRVGRSAAGRALDEQAVRLAVIASVRHLDTDYDELLMSGVPRIEARERIAAEIDRVLRGWT